MCVRSRTRRSVARLEVGGVQAIAEPLMVSGVSTGSEGGMVPSQLAGVSKDAEVRRGEL